MLESPVILIDYGMGNLLSVQRALEYCGASVLQTSNPDVVRIAKRIVLPGVGAFQNGMNELNRRGLVEALKDVAAKGTPILGICLGMQMLLDESEEFGLSNGLGLISGRVVPIPSTTPSGMLQKVPHVGWSPIMRSFKDDTNPFNLLQGVNENDYVYFVHSYMAQLSNPEHLMANTCYGEIQIPAIIRCENVLGCQFHPEKSGEIGLLILKNFLNS